MFVASWGPVLFVAGVAPQAIDVDLDLTFVVQVVLFVGLLLVLKPLLFDPMLRLFEEREKRIDGAKAEARRIDEKSGTALERYEAEMTRVRAAANAERDRIRAEGLAREQELLSRVRTEAARVVDQGKQAAQAEAARVRSQLKLESGEIARTLANRVLGRDVS